MKRENSNLKVMGGMCPVDLLVGARVSWDPALPNRVLGWDCFWDRQQQHWECWTAEK
uniref:Uncharacterized protein n=1 Tax=Crocodylus porosus TaxID=8502 RepID=A0A7M4EDS4_CROPO